MAQFQAVAAAVGFYLLDGGTPADQVGDGADVFREQMQGAPLLNKKLQANSPPIH